MKKMNNREKAPKQTVRYAWKLFIHFLRGQKNVEKVKKHSREKKRKNLKLEFQGFNPNSSIFET